ncbi:MAG: type II secretion system protein [Lacipirellulaceae bacterium]
MKHSPRKTSSPRGFTLTELLIVIAIIAVLASLATTAAINAMNRAKTTRVALEIKELERALLTFKEDNGTLPPNSLTPIGAGPNDAPVNAVRNDVRRVVKKLFPRINANEAQIVEYLIGATNVPGTSPEGGISAGEALVFWLGGFSQDEQFPISGSSGPSFVVGDQEIIENRGFDDVIDVTRLGPRENGQFSGRFILYEDPRDSSIERRINLWMYYPATSVQPYLYFDVSKNKPSDRATSGSNISYAYPLQSPADPNATTPEFIAALKRPLETTTTSTPSLAQTKYANQGKFQILHAGLDDAWGEANKWAAVAQENSPLLFPEGPFTGDIADTLTNFTQGTLEAEQE